MSGDSRRRRLCRLLGLVVALTNTSLAHAQGPVLIPGPGEGYQITKTDSSQMAPSGFEGRADTSTQTAVGNTPATMGKKVVARFTLSNRIKTCPAADGTAEGEGVFSITVDSTDAQASGTSTSHMEMRARAKYKGQVSDDAYLDGPVKAEIEFTYTQSGTFRGPSGALATPAGSNVEQHVTIPFVVAKDLTPPSLGAFSGGDPTQGKHSEAFSVGMALAYWAGVYYSVAQTRWRQGFCVQISFSPPSNTLQPALGTQATVKTEVKTKSGESVKAKFQNARAYSGGRITPTAGASDVGSPLAFTYTAPNQKATSNAGFAVEATSRAGIAAVGEWHTNLGTGWTGQISCSHVNAGDAGSNEQQSWSNFAATRLTINVKDGVGTVNSYTEVNNMQRNLRPVARQGYVFDNSDSTYGIAEGEARATVGVTVYNGTYSISAEHGPFPAGTQHSVSCNRNGCQEQDRALYLTSCLSGLGGPLTDPNQLRGTDGYVRTGLGRSHQGTETLTVTWDLARQGTSR